MNNKGEYRTAPASQGLLNMEWVEIAGNSRKGWKWL